MIIIDDIRIKDNYAHNLPENRDLLRYARENRRAGNMAEIAFWTESFPYDRLWRTTACEHCAVGFEEIHCWELRAWGLWKKGIRMPILLPRPSGTPSKTEGEFARPAQCAVAGNSVRTRVLTSPTTRHWQQKAFFWDTYDWKSNMRNLKNLRCSEEIFGRWGG